MWIFKKNLDSDPFMYFPGFFSKLFKLQPPAASMEVVWDPVSMSMYY